MTEKRGTFLVTHADDDSAVLADVGDGQVHACSSNPGVEAGDVVVGRLAADPPLEVSWSVVEVDERRRVAVERVDAAPGERAVELAAGREPGEVVSEETAEGGALHVLPVTEGNAEGAAADVVEDDATLRRAARLGASRVEVRTGDGLLSVRYEL